MVGLRAGHETQIEPLVAWYRDNGAKARFETVPGYYDPALGRELVRLGYYQSGFHTSLVAEPDLVVAAPPGLVVEPVTSAALMEDYLDAYVAGWGLPAKDHAQFKANVRPWFGQPGWTLYVGRAEGRPAAAATLFVHDKVGYCADASTDPAFRGRGLQTALLARRIADARAAGVDFVCSGADSCRRATATWSGWGCACSSCGRCGRRYMEYARSHCPPLWGWSVRRSLFGDFAFGRDDVAQNECGRSARPHDGSLSGEELAYLSG